MQLALGAAPETTELVVRERQLLSRVGVSDHDLVTLGWRRGFIDSLRFHNDRDDDLDLLPLARHLFGHPMCALLRELRLGDLRWDQQTHDVPAVLAEAARHPWAKHLQRLIVGDISSENIGMAHHQVGDLTGVSAFRALQALTIHAGEFELTELRLPQLTTLAVETCALNRAQFEAVLRAHLPELRSLELWFGSKMYGADVTLPNVGELLASTRWPKLRHLGLMNAEFTDELCELLPHASLLGQLESLDLSMGVMSLAGAKRLAASSAAFSHLAWLSAERSYLSPEGVEVLRKGLTCPTRVDHQRIDLEEDPDEALSDRYVEVWE